MAGKNAIGHDHKLARLTHRASLPLAMSIMLGGIAAVLLIIQMGLLARIVTNLAFRHHSFSQESTITKLLLGTIIVRALCQAAADSYGDYAGIRVTSSLRLDLLRHLYRVGPIRLVGQESGKIATALSEGIEALHPYIARFLPRAAAMVTVPLLILATIFNLDKWSFLILAITGPLIPFFMILVGYGAQAVMNRKWTELLLLGSSFLDMLQGLTTLRIFGRAQQAVSLVASMANAHRKSTIAVMRIAFLTSAALEFFGSLSIALVAVVFGVRLIKAEIPFETSFFVLLLAPEYFMPLRAFSASYHDRQNANGAFKSLHTLFSLPELHQVDAPPPTDPLPHLQSISLKNIHAGYDQDNDILKGIQTELSCNQLTVLTGASGGGKTTLFRLLLGMMPPRQGDILVQTEDGATHPLHALSIGWVPQQPFLMADSIIANLRLSAPDAHETQIEHAAKEAGAWDFISALPEGLNTVLGERGAPLSSGQIRRLALARALLRQPQLLLFDEPTADLDPENARLVANVIAQTTQGRIVLVISHRHDMLKRAAQIIRLNNGKLHIMKPGT